MIPNKLVQYMSRWKKGDLVSYVDEDWLVIDLDINNVATLALLNRDYDYELEVDTAPARSIMINYLFFKWFWKEYVPSCQSKS